MESDDRTFAASYTKEGVSKLESQITHKLKDFLGDYTDETLVEYVMVMLKNGRRKDEAKSELDVFLGDDSDSFVTWLWNHLGSHLSLYVQPLETHQDGAAKAKSVVKEAAVRSESHQDGVTKTKSVVKETAVRTESHQDAVTKTKSVAKEPVGRTKAHQVDPEDEKKPPRNRRNRLWKELVRDEDENEANLPQSSAAGRVNDRYDPVQRVVHTKRSLSPRRTNRKKNRLDEQKPRKRDIPQVPIGGARRLLQFAVRDAVKPATTSTEPSRKRLRSVVSIATGDPLLEERANRSRFTDMSVAIKAVSEAANDVNKPRPQHSIFDRLGQASDFHNITNSEDDIINPKEEYKGFHDEGDYIDGREDTIFPYHEQLEINLPEDVIMSHGDIIMASDMVYGDDNIDLRGQGSLDISGRNWVNDSLPFPSDETHDLDERVRRSHINFDERVQTSHIDMDERVQRSHINLDQPETAYRSSVKVASSVSMDMGRNSQYETVREVHAMDHHKLIQDSDAVVTKSEPWLMKENSNPVIVGNGMAQFETGPQHEFHKTQTPIGVYSTALPTESRTIYVTNVHFAATKDGLSRHFSSCGEVLKVIILTDPATGQPKGSAYLEFMSKEAAENALSLNGTSFLSRMLKVVKKSSAQPEPDPVAVWPHVARASSFPVPRFSRAPFTRGSPSLYRPRVPIKPTRSFQWKRGALPSCVGIPVHVNSKEGQEGGSDEGSQGRQCSEGTARWARCRSRCLHCRGNGHGGSSGGGNEGSTCNLLHLRSGEMRCS